MWWEASPGAPRGVAWDRAGAKAWEAPGAPSGAPWGRADACAPSRCLQIEGGLPGARPSELSLRVGRVAIVVAVRGDELAGAWLGRGLERSPELATRPSFGRAEVVYGNPKAYEAMRGFVDEDRSTQFSADRLEDLTLSAYEASRAKELNRELGPKGLRDRSRVRSRVARRDQRHRRYRRCLRR